VIEIAIEIVAWGISFSRLVERRPLLSLYACSKTVIDLYANGWFAVSRHQK